MHHTTISYDKFRYNTSEMLARLTFFIKIIKFQILRYKNLSSAAGLEPAIFGSGNRRLIHLATRPAY